MGNYQNGNQDHIDIIFQSIAIIFPKITTEEVKCLENELGEELVQKIKELLDFS